VCGGDGQETERTGSRVVASSPRRWKSVDAVAGSVQLTTRACGDYVKAMWTEVAAGMPADALYIPANFLQGVLAQDGLVSEEPYLKREPRGFWAGDLIPEVLNKARWKGQVLGLPWDGASVVLQVNRNLFRSEDAPLPPDDWDDTTWTWDALLGRHRAAAQQSPGRRRQWGKCPPARRWKRSRRRSIRCCGRPPASSEFDAGGLPVLDAGF
jgi:hypothetical protein